MLVGSGASLFAYSHKVELSTRPGSEILPDRYKITILRIAMSLSNAAAGSGLHLVTCHVSDVIIAHGVE